MLNLLAYGEFLKLLRDADREGSEFTVAGTIPAVIPHSTHFLDT